MLKIPNLSVYLKENVPQEFHYQSSDRIGIDLYIQTRGYIKMTKIFLLICYHLKHP